MYLLNIIKFIVNKIYKKNNILKIKYFNFNQKNIFNNQKLNMRHKRFENVEFIIKIG